jgi:hypothetical protein
MEVNDHCITPIEELPGILIKIMQYVYSIIIQSFVSYESLRESNGEK